MGLIQVRGMNNALMS